MCRCWQFFVSFCKKRTQCSVGLSWPTYDQLNFHWQTLFPLYFLEQKEIKINRNSQIHLKFNEPLGTPKCIFCFFICYQERKFSNTNWCIYHHLRCVLSPQVLVTNPKIKDCWWRNFESNFIHLRPRRCILWYFATVAACLDWLQLSCKRCLSQPATARQAGEPVPLQNKNCCETKKWWWWPSGDPDTSAQCPPDQLISQLHPSH